jgi:alkylhydroperoxidase/carboxymuconolactone decarboxylase family protein YurZ
MNERTHDLILASALAARPEFRERLREHLLLVKEKGVPLHTELYEAFLQLYLFAGFPAALEAERLLMKIWTHHEGSYEVEDFYDTDEFIQRGHDLYKKVYAANSNVVRTELTKISPELAAWALVEGYGKTLSRSGLDPVSRELCIVGILTQLEWERQLFSHLLGAKNVGSSSQDIGKAIGIGSLGDERKRKVAEQLAQKIV